MNGHHAAGHVELVNVQGPENAMMYLQVEIKIILARPICFKEKLVTHKNVPFTQNGRNGHHAPLLVAEEAKTGREYVSYL